MADTLSPRASMRTDVGRRRQVNEDWCGVLKPQSAGYGEEEGWLWVVADGVGAYGTGEEASRMAGEATLRTYRQADPADPATRLRRALEAANRTLWERRRDYVRRGRERPVMTTLLAALLAGDRFILANVGDCRAYLIKNGRITQLTRDHTWVGEQIARGQLSSAEARSHPQRHVISRSLGQHDTVEVDLFEQPVEAGDRLVLCSDGLTLHLEDEEILQIASRGSPETAVKALLDLANARGGEDNVTTVVIETVTATLEVPAPVVSSPSAPTTPEGADGRPSHPAELVRAPSDPSTAQTGATAQRGLPPRVAASRDHLATLHTIGQRISASLDLNETLTSVMDSVVEMTGGERGCIMLWDETSRQLVYSVGRNLVPAGNQVPDLSQNIIRSVFDSGQPIRIGDALADPRFNQYQSVLVRSLRSILCAPLQARGGRIGVVYVDNSLGDEMFSETDLELLCAFADQAAIALENARLHAQLKAQMDEIATMRRNQADVLRSLTSAIIALDAHGRVVVFNPAAEALFAVRAEYALQGTLDGLLPATLRRALGALAAAPIGDHESSQDCLQMEVALPNRGRVLLAMRVLPLVDPSNLRVGSVLIVDDVSQQRLLEEARQREATAQERIKAIFGRYLAPSVMEQLMAEPDSVQLGGTRREVTVLFADMRGFTGLAEQRPPEEVVSILNSYLAHATDVIQGAGGSLDKFLGDGVMALFNAPLAQEDHVRAAVRAAMQLQSRLRNMQGPGGPRIGFGVGINTGEGIVGNIGTAELMNYTVVGDVVNVAARLQSEARSGEVLLSGSSYGRIADSVEVEELGPMHVKGRAQPVSIYKVLRVFD